MSNSQEYAGLTELQLAMIRSAVHDDKTNIIDTDAHFTVDVKNKLIVSSDKRKLVQFSHNSERVTFDCDRYIEGHDVMLCNVKQIHYLDDGIYDIDDLEVNPEDDTKVTFSWLISGNATKQVIKEVPFSLLLECVQEDGTCTYTWDTEENTSLYVVKGRRNTQSVAYKYADVLEQWKQQFENDTSFSGSASDVTYDDTETKIGAENVQDAIGKLSKQIDNQSGTGLSTEAIDKLDEAGNYLPFTSAEGGKVWDELIAILRKGSSGGGDEEPDTPVVPEVTLTAISVTYDGGDVAVGTALTDLTGITVKAVYSDGTSEAVTGYTLSGEIVEGINTITVSYSGKTATFTVVGIAESTGGGDGGEVTLLKNIAFDGTSYLDTEIIPESVNYKYVLGIQAPNTDLIVNKNIGGVSGRNSTNPANSDYWEMYWKCLVKTNNYNADIPTFQLTYHCMGLDSTITTGQDKGDGASSQPYENPLYYSFDNGSQSVWLNEDLTETPITGHFPGVTTTVDFTNQSNYTDDEHPIHSIWLGKVHVTADTMASLATKDNTYVGVKFYCFKVYDENDNLIADMKPAKQGDTIGMYCNVRQKFFTGNGTLTYEEQEVA